MSKQKEMPEFKTEAEERAFWENHDSSEYLDWSQAKRTVLPKLKSSTKTISLRLPEANHLLRHHKVNERRPTRLSQEALAASVGVTRQSVHRVVRDWQLQGWVTVEYGNVSVADIEALNTFVALSESVSN